jgi:prepilin-type processing-associated H-X9-DG protein
MVPGYSDDNCPSIIQWCDWASPIAKIMNVKFDEGGDDAARARRYVTMRDLPQFRCPNNEIIAPQFGSNVDNAIVGAGRMVSYNTALPFLVTRNTSGSTSPDEVGVSIARPEWNVPAGYNTKISKVGDPARKVFIADGAKFSAGNKSPSVAQTYPDADLNYVSQLGGAFADQGPSRFTRAWNRDRTPANGGSGVDCRIFWARHSSNVKPGAKSGTFRFNIGFFDGHVETVDDLAGANPSLWYPKGTLLKVDVNQQWDDVMQRYFPGGIPPSPGPGIPAGNIIVP